MLGSSGLGTPIEKPWIRVTFVSGRGFLPFGAARCHVATSCRFPWQRSVLSTSARPPAACAFGAVPGARGPDGALRTSCLQALHKYSAAPPPHPQAFKRKPGRADVEAPSVTLHMTLQLVVSSLPARCSRLAVPHLPRYWIGSSIPAHRRSASARRDGLESDPFSSALLLDRSFRVHFPNRLFISSGRPIRRSCKLSPRVSMSSSPFSPPPEDQSLETEAPHAPVTRERRLNPDLDRQLPKPCMQLDPIDFLSA